MAVNIQACVDKLLVKNDLLEELEVSVICELLKELLVQEPNVVRINTPVNIVGDVHGQFFDLLEIFKISGLPPDSNYLFLGDYVDRGYHSVETISLLCCLKLLHPQRVMLLRGNHESRAVTQVYGFYNECMEKYGNANVWRYFTDMFDYMTISALIDDEIFCVHGGISPSVQCIDHIRVLDRFREIPHEGAICDMMWSDPEPSEMKQCFAISPRGAGYTFGSEVVRHFNRINGTSLILRAHQLCMEGYQVLFDEQLMTVWSAPNYCYRCGNLASVLEINDVHSKKFNIFEAAPRKPDKTPGQIIKNVDSENQYFL